jgi:hypothetical protein
VRSIDHLLVIAGPTAGGKSRLIGKIRAREAPELEKILGAQDLHDWPEITAGALRRQPDLKQDRLILHYDFLWPYPASVMESPDGELTLSLLQGAREIAMITLWTPHTRLARQLVESRLRGRVRGGPAEALKVLLLRAIPAFAVTAMSRLRCWNAINRRLPTWGLVHHLLALGIYSNPARAVAMYRSWFRFCDERLSHVRAHVIVEVENELSIFSRDEWEKHVNRIEEV